MAGEMIRVRVLFLKKGDIACKSDFDGCLTPEIEEDCYSDNLEHEYWKLSPQDFVQDGLIHGLMSPNDPPVVLLRDCTLVYFDLLHMNSDWSGAPGGLGHEVECTGLWDTFHRWLPDLIEHAQTTPSPRTSWIFDNGEKKPYGPDGTRAQFLTLWNYWTTRHSSPDYGEDWDSDYDLAGTFEPGEPVKPLRKLQKAVA